MGERTAPAVAPVICDQPVAERLLGEALHAHVEGGAHRETAFVERLVAEARHDLAADLFREPRGGDVFGLVALAHDERLLPGGLGLSALDPAVLEHAVDDPVAAILSRDRNSGS